MLSFMGSWLTPASLFVLLNLMIGIIALVSRFGSHRKPHEEGEHQHHHHQLARAPSLLQRVRSIDFSFYRFPPPQESDYTAQVDPPQLERAPSLLQRVKSINFSSFYRSEPEFTQLADEPESDQNPGTGHYSGPDSGVDHHVKRSKSDHMEATKRQQQVPEKMKKSASEKAVASFDNDDDEKLVERRRPATTRLEKTALFGDEGVDAKADDFINRFKQQLKLQRLDSLLRYKEMLKGKKI